MNFSRKWRGLSGRVVVLLLVGVWSQRAHAFTEIEVPPGTVYTIADPDNAQALVEFLSEENREVFQKKRVAILKQALAHIHRSKLIRLGCYVGATTRNVFSRDCVATTEAHQVAVRYMASSLNRFLFEHAGLLVDSDVHGFQVSLGGAFGAAFYRWGSAHGVWLTLHFDRLDEGFKARVSFDWETLRRGLPAIFTAGVAVKGLFFFGKHSHRADTGTSIYPAVLPHVQLTQRTAAVGYSVGLFFPPSPYTLYLEQTLRRSRSLPVPTPRQIATNSKVLCTSLLQAAGLGWSKSQSKDSPPSIPEPTDSGIE